MIQNYTLIKKNAAKFFSLFKSLPENGVILGDWVTG
jgi:hypothetical protein